MTNRVAVVTGAGGGIGYEAARSLIWLGARVIVAEIDTKTGPGAAEQLNQEFGRGVALFVRTDVGDERSVKKLARRADRAFGKVDVVLNNATIVPLGAAKDIDVEAWDSSYRVNLRGPVLLARAFIPGMVCRNWGVFVSVSSAGGAYMGAYESFKVAQEHLSTTLDDELQETDVAAFTIGPGFVPTPTAMSSLSAIAAMMGKSQGELLEAVKAHTLSVPAAGAGFAAAVAMAANYRGQEISSMQALVDAGISMPTTEQGTEGHSLGPEDLQRALRLCRAVHTTLTEQSMGWQERSVFERQWLLRTFRRKATLPVEEWVRVLGRVQQALERQDFEKLATINAPLGHLTEFYRHLLEMAKGYEKDPTRRDEQLRIVAGWQTDVEQLDSLLR